MSSRLLLALHSHDDRGRDRMTTHAAPSGRRDFDASNGVPSAEARVLNLD